MLMPNGINYFAPIEYDAWIRNLISNIRNLIPIVTIIFIIKTKYSAHTHACMHAHCTHNHNNEHMYALCTWKLFKMQAQCQSSKNKLNCVTIISPCNANKIEEPRLWRFFRIYLIRPFFYQFFYVCWFFFAALINFFMFIKLKKNSCRKFWTNITFICGIYIVFFHGNDTFRIEYTVRCANRQNHNFDWKFTSIYTRIEVQSLFVNSLSFNRRCAI